MAATPPPNDSRMARCGLVSSPLRWVKAMPLAGGASSHRSGPSGAGAGGSGAAGAGEVLRGPHPHAVTRDVARTRLPRSSRTQSLLIGVSLRLADRLLGFRTRSPPAVLGGPLLVALALKELGEGPVG